MHEIETSTLLLTEFYYSFTEDDVKDLMYLIHTLNESSNTLYNNTSVLEVTSKLPLLPYDLSDWGPKRDSLFIVIPITLLYIAIFVTGLLGNVCTCVVISRNKSMHTATNYYLFSLAISDLLLLISGLPTEIYSTWSKYPYIFGEIFCILQGFAAETSANATVLTITAFTIERYVAICHPFLSHTMSKLSRAIKFVIVIWLLAMCLALPQAMAFGIFYEQLPDGHPADNDHYVCTVKRVVIPHAFEISTFVFFIAPMSVITILYILIGLRIHKSTTGRARDGSVRLKHRKTKIFFHSPNRPVTNLHENKADKIQLTYEEEGRKNYPRNSQASKHVVKMLELKINIWHLKVIEEPEISEFFSQIELPLAERINFRYHLKIWKNEPTYNENIPCSTISTNLRRNKENSHNGKEPQTLETKTLEQSLKECFKGRNIIERYSHSFHLSLEDRKVLVDIICENGFNKNETISLKDIEKYTNDIIELFPTEKKEYYYVPRQGSKDNPKGKLYDKVRNLRHLMIKQGQIAKTPKKKIHDSKLLDPKMDQIEHQNITEDDEETRTWLKFNYDQGSTTQEILEKWQQVENLRQRDCHTKPLEEILREWPLYKHATLGVQMINSDFNMNHPEKTQSLFNNWETFKTKCRNVLGVKVKDKNSIIDLNKLKELTDEIAVVVAFFICWAPFHAQRLLAIYGQPDSSNMVTTFNVLTYVSGVFYYLSTTINPLLYHIMSHKFRVAFKDTIMRFLRRKPRPIGERCYSALSGRSSQANSQNSQSNTDSCSQQSSLRYLETEMRRLRDSRRPLVVSFRRKQPPVQKVKQVTILDAELQKALDSLTEESKKIDKEGRFLKASRSSIRKQQPSHHSNNDIPTTHHRHHETRPTTWGNLNPDFGFIELHNLESSSGFAANGILKPSWQNCSDVDIEIFREQQLRLSNSKRSYNILTINSNEYGNEFVNGDHKLTKSCTMPDINRGPVPMKRPFYNN